MAETRSFKSSEELTKFLRGKGSKLEDVVACAESLLLGEYNVKVPLKEVFLVELVLDKVNDAKGVEYRLSHGLWRVLIAAWNGLNAMARLNVCHKYTFPSILLGLFDTLVAKSAVIGVSAVAQIMRDGLDFLRCLLKDNLCPAPTIDVMIKLLTQYFQILSICDTMGTACLLKSTHEPLLQLFRMTIVERRVEANKLSKELSQKAVVPMIRLLSMEDLEREMLPVTLITHVLSKQIPSKMTMVSFDTLLSGCLAIEDAEECAVTVRKMYQLAIQSVPSKDSSFVDAVYAKCIEKLPNIGKDLLQITFDCNRKLSMESLEQVLTGHLAADAETDWEVVLWILKLEVDVCLKYAGTVLDQLKDKPNVEDWQPLVEQILKTYVQTREFPRFFELWTSLAADVPWMTSRAFCLLVSKQIHHLSLKQKKTLMQSNLAAIKDEQVPAVNLSQLIATIRGLEASELHQMDQEFASILGVSSSQPLLWELKYLILSVAPGAIHVSRDEVIDDILDAVTESPQQSEFVYYTALRTRELVPYDSFSVVVDDLLKQFEDVKAVVLSSSLTALLRTLLVRFPVVVNRAFSSGQIELFATSVLSFLACIPTAEEFLKQIPSVLYEQSLLVRQLISVASKKLQELKDQPERHIECTAALKLLHTTPAECFSRKARAELVENLLIAYCSSPGNSNVNLLALLCLDSITNLTLPGRLLSVDELSSIFCSWDDTARSEAVVKRVLLHTIRATRGNNEDIKSFIKTCRRRVKHVSLETMTQNPAELESTMKSIWVAHAVVLTPGSSLEKEMTSLKKTVLEKVKEILLKVSSLGSARGKDASSRFGVILSGLIDVYNSLRSPTDQQMSKELCAVLGKLLDRGSSAGTVDESVLLRVFSLFSQLLQPREFSLLAAIYISLPPVSLTTKTELQSVLSSAVAGFPPDVQEHVLYELLLTMETSLEAQKTPELSGYFEVLGSIWRAVDNFVPKAREGEDTSNSEAVAAQERAIAVKHFVKILRLFEQWFHNARVKGDIFSPDDFQCCDRILSIVSDTLTSKSWAVSQYAIEQVIVVLTSVSRYIYLFAGTAGNVDAAVVETAACEQLYQRLCRTTSTVVLLYRYRLNGRMHLLLLLFTSLLENLSRPHKRSFSESSAVAFNRLVENLCEPRVHETGKRASSGNLNSQVSAIKRNLRPHVGSLLCNFIWISLHQRFPPQIKDKLVEGFYPVFNLLTANELGFIGATLDLNGVGYFRELVRDYEKHGKWKDQ